MKKDGVEGGGGSKCTVGKKKKKKEVVRHIARIEHKVFHKTPLKLMVRPFRAPQLWKQ